MLTMGKLNNKTDKIRYKKCDNCQLWHWTNEECDPEYFVTYEEYTGDTPVTVRANNHENAARLFAQNYNTRNDYCLMNENINVKVEKDGIIKYFNVGAEPDIHYTSNEIEAPEKN